MKKMQRTKLSQVIREYNNHFDEKVNRKRRMVERRSLRECFDASPQRLEEAIDVGKAFVRQVISHNHVRVVFCDHSFLSCNDILECRSHLLVNEGDLVTVARHDDGRGNLYCVIEGICRVAWSRNIPLSSYDDIDRGVNTCLQDMYARFITELKPQVDSLRGTNITKSSKGQVQTMELGLSIVLNSLKMYDFVCRCSFLFIDNNENERQLSQQQEILRKFLTKFDCLGFISSMLSEVLWRDWKNMLKSINVLGDRNTICPLYKKMELPEDFVDESLIVNLLFMDKESEDVVSLMELKRKHVGKIKSRPKLCRFLKKIGLRWMTSTIS